MSDTIANATTADASELQAILNDIATALTGSMAADGQTPITGQMLGLVSANPAWSFVGDANTGFGSDSADEAWVKAGGTEVVTVVASGATVTGTANVTGAATLSSTANVVGNFSVATNKFNVTAASGDTAVAGTLAVTGATTLTGGVGAVASTSTVSGTDITASGALSGATVAGAMVATQAQMETGTATNLLVSPGRQHFHPAAAKAWGNIQGSNGADLGAYNITSYSRSSAGVYVVTIANDLSSTNYVVTVSCFDSTFTSYGFLTTKTAGSFTITVVDAGGTARDPNTVSFVVFGDI